jgi:hypothetical protein
MGGISLFSKVRQARTGDFDLSKYSKNRWLGMKQQPGPGLTLALCIHLSAMEQHNNISANVISFFDFQAHQF